MNRSVEGVQRVRNALFALMWQSDRVWMASDLLPGVIRRETVSVFNGPLAARTRGGQLAVVWSVLEEFESSGYVARHVAVRGETYWRWVPPVYGSPSVAVRVSRVVSGVRAFGRWLRDRLTVPVGTVTGTVTALALMLVAAFVVAVVSGDGARESGRTVPAGPVASDPVGGIQALPVFSGEGCQEDEACFDSCGMGLDVSRPVGDPRRVLPGPCDFDRAVLPGDRVFAVDFVPLLDGVAGVEACAGAGGPAGWRLATVTVSVVDESGVTVPGTAVTADMCVPGVDDQVPAGVSEVMPELYRMAGAPELYRRS